MILRTQENKANKKYEFNDFEFFYNFFQRLVNNENSMVFSAYEQDVECFNVFAYDDGKHYSYYIPDELRKIIKEELGF